MNQPTLTDWQAALQAAEREGSRLTWGDARNALYVAVMGVAGAILAIILLGGQ